MMLRPRTRQLIVAALVIGMVACLKKPPQPAGPVTAPPPAPPPPPVTLELTANADVNPDASGRPSPIVVRIFQLGGDTAFMAAEFLALYDEEQKTLGSDLIGKSQEFTVRPGETLPVPVQVAVEARFLGAMAGYRDYRHATWRLVVPAPIKRSSVLSVGRAGLTFNAK